MSQPPTDSPAVGSAEVSLMLGNAQHTSQVGTNDAVTLDLGSNPYLVLGSQASSLDQMPLGPMAGSQDPSIMDDIDPDDIDHLHNLAFLNATIGHSTSMTNVTIQGCPSNFASTTGKPRRLTRHQVLIKEARDFLETTVGDTHTSSTSQPDPLFGNPSLGPTRNTSSQVMTTNYGTTSPRRTRNGRRE